MSDTTVTETDNRTVITTSITSIDSDPTERRVEDVDELNVDGDTLPAESDGVKLELAETVTGESPEYYR